MKTPNSKLQTSSAPLTAPLRAARAFDQALALVLDRNRMDHQCRALLVHGCDDERLIGLSARLSAIGGDVSSLIWVDTAEERDQCRNNLRFNLANLAAYALIWATAGQRNYVRGCRRIQQERERQKELLAAGKIIDDVASPATTGLARFRVLLEEVGEVAHAIDQVKHHGLAAGNIGTELIQVAAVCVAWLESLEGNHQTLIPPIRANSRQP